MSRTYFAISDPHSFLKATKEALRDAGYDPTDPDHVLIVCGDVFDRGDESMGMLKFLKSIPKDRRVLIRGNHERLLRECYRRGVFYEHDLSNGTLKTMCHLSGVRYEDLDRWYRMAVSGLMGVDEFSAKRDALWEDIKEKPFKSRRIGNVLKWMWSDEWVDFYELGDYVFVHSWIPTKWVYDDEGLSKKEVVDPNWRSAGEAEWDEASWGCPWKKYLAGLRPEGKTVVCGHWHASDFHTHLGHDVEGYLNRNIYFGDGIVALDAMTAKEPHMVNVLVIKDGKCYDKHYEALK